MHLSEQTVLTVDDQALHQPTSITKQTTNFKWELHCKHYAVALVKLKHKTQMTREELVIFD